MPVVNREPLTALCDPRHCRDIAAVDRVRRRREPFGKHRDQSLRHDVACSSRKGTLPVLPGRPAEACRAHRRATDGDTRGSDARQEAARSKASSTTSSEAFCRGIGQADTGCERQLAELPTDRGGSFAFRALAAGDYELVTDLPGFTTVKNVIRAEPGAAVRRHITLPLGTLEETILVTCGVADLPRPTIGAGRSGNTR